MILDSVWKGSQYKVSTESMSIVPSSKSLFSGLPCVVVTDPSLWPEVLFGLVLRFFLQTLLVT